LVYASLFLFFFSSRRRHTRFSRDWSSDVCSSDLAWSDALSDVALPEGEGLAGLDPRMDTEAFDGGRDTLPDADSGLDTEAAAGPEADVLADAEALPGPDAPDVPPGSWSEAPEADRTRASAESGAAPARAPRRAREATGSSLLFWLLLGGLALALALVLLI